MRWRAGDAIWLLGALGQLPRVKASTKGEGSERRYFYGSVWAVCWAQPVLWLLWKVVPIFATLFAGLGVDLPLPTKIVIAAGVIVACGRKAAPTRWRTLTVAVSGTTLAIEPDDGKTPGAC